MLDKITVRLSSRSQYYHAIYEIFYMKNNRLYRFRLPVSSWRDKPGFLTSPMPTIDGYNICFVIPTLLTEEMGENGHIHQYVYLRKEILIRLMPNFLNLFDGSDFNISQLVIPFFDVTDKRHRICFKSFSDASLNIGWHTVYECVNPSGTAVEVSTHSIEDPLLLNPVISDYE